VSPTPFDLLALLALAAGVWLTWTSLRAREAANAAIRAACAERAYLFLDDTVGLVSMRPIRDDRGRLSLRRVYSFEYSDTGHERRPGSVMLIGDEVVEVAIGELPPATLH